MKIGILAAMEEEVTWLLKHLQINNEMNYGNQKFYDGIIANQQVTLVQSGIGKVNAAIATTLLIEHFNCELVLNTGSAGGIGEGLSIGELIVADNLAYQDVDNRVFNYDYGQIPQMPASYHVKDKWLNTLVQSAENIFDVKVGQIVTGDSFISSKDQIAKIKNYFPKALVTEMEGAAVAQTCYQFGVPSLVVRCVSDVADEQASVDFDEFIKEAGKKSAQFVLQWLKDL